MAARACSRPYARSAGSSEPNMSKAARKRGAGRLGTRPAALKSSPLTEHPDHAADHSDQAHVGGHDRFVGGVLGDQLDVSVAALESLHRGVTVDEGDHDGAVAGFLLWADQDEVAVEDAGVDHAVAAHMEEEVAFLRHVGGQEH